MTEPREHDPPLPGNAEPPGPPPGAPDWMEAAWHDLTRRKRYIVAARLGVGDEAATRATIGGHLNLSEQRVRQLEFAATWALLKAGPDLGNRTPANPETNIAVLRWLLAQADAPA